MPATLRDIATACGMDISTVSRALRDNGRVAASTRKRIHRIARQMGYEPNLAARSLVGARTRTIWFVTPTITGRTEQRSADIASRLLAEREYDLLLMLYHDDPNRYVNILRRLDQGVTDGAIVIPGPLGQGRAELTRLAERDFPLLFLDRHPEFAEQPTVTTDNASGSAQMVTMAIEEGADAFVLLYGEENPVERERRRGAIETLGRRGIPFILGDSFKAADVGTARTVCIAGTADGHVRHVAEKRAAQLRGKRLVYECFDHWTTDPHPATCAFVCVQDSQELASRSVQMICDLLDGERARDATTLVPPLRVDCIRTRS